MTLDDITTAKEWIESMNRAHSPFVQGNIIPVYATLLKLCDQAILKRQGDQNESRSGV